jgi:adenylylsulfate kinase
MPIIQLTGLSGCGKTTLSNKLKYLLAMKNITCHIVDGDQYRSTIFKDLGFSKDDRCENIRRLGKVAFELSQEADVVVIAAINPYCISRDQLEMQYGARLVWVDCPVNELIRRDTKGLYQKALLPNGHPNKIYNLTGINDTYEAPENYDLKLNTYAETADECAGRLFNFITANCLTGYAHVL